MASQTFDLSGSTTESSAVSVGAGESLRVRFTDLSHGTTARLKIVANSTTTYVEIDRADAWVTGAVAESDSCTVVAQLGKDSAAKAAGIIETFS